jgi:AraC-like DNA-binding protein
MNELAGRCRRRGWASQYVTVNPYPLGVATWPAAMIVWSPGFTSTPHQHPAMQLVLTLSGSLRIRGGRHRRWLRRRPGALERCSRGGHPAQFRGPRLRPPAKRAGGRPGRTAYGRHHVRRPAAGLGMAGRTWITGESGQLEHWVARRLLNGQSPSGDGRLRRVLTYVRARIATSSHFPLSVLAQVAGLSASRLQHVFRQEFGVAVRPYIRWLRLQRAACDLIAGARIAQAAYAAGCSDTAHMSRTFRSTLGLAPSDISRRVHVDLGLWHP